MDKRIIVLGFLVVSVFTFLVAVLVFVYALYSNGQSVPAFLEPFLTYHIQFMVLMGLFGVFSGLIAFKLLSSTLEKQEKIVKTNIQIIYKFLGSEEREILDLLLSKGGMTTQSEISHLPGMTRLKAHRVVQKLEARGIIHVEKNGKLNLIRLVEELQNLKVS